MVLEAFFKESLVFQWKYKKNMHLFQITRSGLERRGPAAPRLTRDPAVEHDDVLTLTAEHDDVLTLTAEHDDVLTLTSMQNARKYIAKQ